MMSDYYFLIKHIHKSCAYLSVTLLLCRIFLSVYRPSALSQKYLKILPHAIDTLLLLCALMMVSVIGINHSFIWTKLILLVFYIVSGYLTLKVFKSIRGKFFGALTSLSIFILIVGVAVSKSPYSWWAIYALKD